MSLREEKLSRYKEPSSTSEGEKQQRAERMLRQVLDVWSASEEITLRYHVKGSYANKTNDRTDSDVDIAVIHGGMHYYNDSALRASDKINGRVAIPYYKEVNLRRAIEVALVAAYGTDCDTTGRTALTITENSGRVSTDVVPSFDHRTYYYDSVGQIRYIAGTITHRTDGTHVINYPQQQLDNGRAKNTDTGGRYKQVVRILKRLENDLVASGSVAALPSYFIECLVYPISNMLFLVTADNDEPLTEICRSVFAYIYVATKPGGIAVTWKEPNGIKDLFETSQPWTMAQANVLASEAFAVVNARAA